MGSASDESCFYATDKFSYARTVIFLQPIASSYTQSCQRSVEPVASNRQGARLEVSKRTIITVGVYNIYVIANQVRVRHNARFAQD